MIIVRVGASMYFANVAFIRDYISKMISEFSEATNIDGEGARQGPRTEADSSNGGASDAEEGAANGDAEGGKANAAAIDGGSGAAAEISYIVMEMTPVMSIDSTAVHMLEDLHRDLKERGIRLAFSTVNNNVEDTLKRAGLIAKMGGKRMLLLLGMNGRTRVHCPGSAATRALTTCRATLDLSCSAQRTGSIRRCTRPCSTASGTARASRAPKTTARCLRRARWCA